ncbi:hypothetical protein C8R45DRAFT_930262 [Mycena sanguinolenta]|nr:hypothetical protein C8R45DRAFT_930262 [Mycena sanguinolenta]
MFHLEKGILPNFISDLAAARTCWASSDSLRTCKTRPHQSGGHSGVFNERARICHIYQQAVILHVLVKRWVTSQDILSPMLVLENAGKPLLVSSSALELTSSPENEVPSAQFVLHSIIIVDVYLYVQQATPRYQGLTQISQFTEYNQLTNVMYINILRIFISMQLQWNIERRDVISVKQWDEITRQAEQIDVGYETFTAETEIQKDKLYSTLWGSLYMNPGCMGKDKESDNV